MYFDYSHISSVPQLHKEVSYVIRRYFLPLFKEGMKWKLEKFFFLVFKDAQNQTVAIFKNQMLKILLRNA